VAIDCLCLNVRVGETVLRFACCAGFHNSDSPWPSFPEIPPLGYLEFTGSAGLHLCVIFPFLPDPFLCSLACSHFLVGEDDTHNGPPFARPCALTRC